MGNLRFWMGTAAALTLGTAGCEGVANGPTVATSAKAPVKAQVRTVTGTLRGVHGKVAVAAKTQDGKLLKAVINPKTHQFSINLPKGKSALLTVKDGAVAKKVLFVKSRMSQSPDGTDPTDTTGATDTTDPANAEPTDPQGLEGMIPGDDFSSDADLGDVDFEDGEDIVCGDEDGEDSIFEYVDEDGDGSSDFDDDDDDGDGVADDNGGDEGDDSGKPGEMAWADDSGEWGEDGWYDDNDFCDLDANGTALCEPADDEFVSESECDEEGGSEFCYAEGDSGYYDNDDQDWWTHCDGGHGHGGDDSADDDSADDDSADDDSADDDSGDDHPSSDDLYGDDHGGDNTGSDDSGSDDSGSDDSGSDDSGSDDSSSDDAGLDDNGVDFTDDGSTDDSGMDSTDDGATDETSA